MDEPGLWSEAEKQKLRILYSDRTLSLNEIASKFGRSSTSIEHRARKLGLQRRHKHAAINQRYFQEITSTEQAYLLGLLAADGSISSTPGRYNICLALKHSDAELIMRFRDAIAPQAVVEL